MPDAEVWWQLIALKLSHQKMLPEQDGFSNVSELSPGLFWLQKVQVCFSDCPILIFYLSVLPFSLGLCYTDYFCHLEWFSSIELRRKKTPFLRLIGSQEANKIQFSSTKKRESVLWNCIMRGTPSLSPFWRLFWRVQRQMRK